MPYNDEMLNKGNKSLICGIPNAEMRKKAYKDALDFWKHMPNEYRNDFPTHQEYNRWLANIEKITYNGNKLSYIYKRSFIASLEKYFEYHLGSPRPGLLTVNNRNLVVGEIIKERERK